MVKTKRIAEPIPPVVDWITHLRNWHMCEDCPLSKTRIRVVLYREFNYGSGTTPFNPRERRRCDILIIGEGPGEAEDVTGLPFKGPAGSKLNKTLREAIDQFLIENPNAAVPVIGITNIIACRPVSVTGGNRDPSNVEAEACRSRLEELIVMLEPSDIVLAGKVPVKLFPRGVARIPKTFPFVRATHTIVHPSYLIQIDNPSNRDMQTAIMRTSLTSILAKASGRKR